MRQGALLRQTSPTRKLEMVAELNETVRALMLAGLAKRYPDETQEKRKRRYAGLVLGEELAEKVYGPLEECTLPRSQSA